MSGINLFSRLAGYSQNPNKLNIENYCTELLAHFFNTERVFRRRFLKVIFRDQRMARPFKWAEAATQESLGHDCRVDLVLRAGSRIHLIEVKLGANETLSDRWGQRGKPQLQRYVDLRKGNVTYLTTSATLAPDVVQGRRRFRLVKHALFEELHKELSRAPISNLTKMLLEFMEDNSMAGPKPFAKKEIKRAEDAFDILQKCQSTLDLVRTEINDEFRSNIHTRKNLTRPAFRSGYGYMDSYLRNYRCRAVRFVGVTLSAEEGGLEFAVYLWGSLHPSIRKIRENLGWYKYDDEHWCFSSISLHGNHNDIRRMIAHAKRASAELGRAIKRFA